MVRGGCRTAPRQLQGSAAWFFVAAGLTSCKLELQLRKLDTLRGCRFGGLGLRWVVLSNALTATANPSPPSLQPRQTHHRSHASQVLSYSFKPAAPYGQGPETSQTRTPAQQNHYLQTCKASSLVGWGLSVQSGRTRSQVTQTPAHHMCSPHQQQISASFALSLPPRSRLPEHPAGHLGGNNA